MSLLRPQTLLGRTVQSLALAFLLFGLISAALLQYTLVLPHAKQSADDLAALLTLVAQIWVELPPMTRPDYERELLRRHQLRILSVEAPHAEQSESYRYIDYLEAALSRQLRSEVHIHTHADHPGWMWADFPMGGRIMRLGFREGRLHNRILIITPFVAAIGLFTAFILSVLLVRRVTHPLAVISEATHRIGKGDFSASIPETGPHELAELARKMNQMESQIGRLLENRTTLLAGISHDLRTPLARMRLELEFLETDANQEMVEGLRNDLTEMEELIADALLLAKGLGGAEQREIDIMSLLEDIAAAHRGDQQRITLDGAHDCVRTVNVPALKRVVGNLVENAMIYGEGSPVELACARSPAGILISVGDRGPGIPAGQQQRVFEPFFRLEASRNKATGGSGLGLAVVRQLCNANGWEVQISSPPGGGTRIGILLPDHPPGA